MSENRQRIQATRSETIIGRTNRPDMPRFLAYALPHAKEGTGATIHHLEDFDLNDAPLCHSDSFLDFDGVVLMAGAFETISVMRQSYTYETTANVKFSAADLDRRHKEFYTIRQQKKPFIFLVPPIPRKIGRDNLHHSTDLFRRVMSELNLEWWNLEDSLASLPSKIPEFESFVERYGSTSVCFHPADRRADWATIIVGASGAFAGFALERSLFFLPCHEPGTHDQAVEIAGSAVRCVLSYRRRMSTEMPQWADEFRFNREIALREKVDHHRSEIVELEGDLAKYSEWKGALCYQSDPLVDIVVKILKSVFRLRIYSKEKFIDDAQILDDDGKTIAVVEIKGPNRNFGRGDVNQVDSHRERLDLRPEMPGLLIMNTLTSAKSLPDKDQAPHPEIIAKAVKDNVLLVRTLDLLRYADLVDTGAANKEQFLATILNESGWLKVQDGCPPTVEKK